MCYDVAYLTKRAEKYEEHFGVKKASVEAALKKVRPAYHAMGYDHPMVPVLTPEVPDELILLEWGLIPFFVKDTKNAVILSNKTLNARGESIFETASFKSSAPSKRCLLMVDGFFEHHHRNGKTYPYYIKMKDDSPFLMGGIYAHWKNESEGIRKTTVSLITTEANPLMKKIHNGGENAGRMPFVVPEDLAEKWLSIDGSDKVGKEEVLSLIRPFEHSRMTAYPVGRLRGKEAIGNTTLVQEEKNYAELSGAQQPLF